MKISVVMTCYNSEKYLAEAIDSILNQTFSDFEFIIWNDGSTDRTEEIIKSYDDPRIRYFYHENTGIGMALRLACQEAKCSVIARMDSDDISMPDRLEKEYNYLQEHPDVVLISSAIEYIDSEGKSLGRTFPFTIDRCIRKAMLRSKGGYICHPAAMYRKDAYDKAGGYYPMKRAQDVVLFRRMIKYGKVKIYPKPLLKYRRFPENTFLPNDGYLGVIRAYFSKIVQDEIGKPEDVRIYNEIVNEFYKDRRLASVETIAKLRQNTKEEYMNAFISFFLGKTLGERLTYTIKNFAGIML